MIGLLTLSAHFIGDFYIQGRALEQKKERSVWFLLLHAVLYILPAAVLLLAHRALGRFISVVLFMFIIHLIAEFVKKGFSARKKRSALSLFLIDQLPLLLILCAAAYLTKDQPLDQSGMYYAQQQAAEATIPQTTIWYVIVSVLFLVKPCMIFNRAVLLAYQNAGEDESAGLEARQSSGSLIGILERLVIFALCLYDQFIAAGILLAVKSAVLFRRHAQDACGESFMIGTLLSALEAFALGLIIKLI